MLSPSSTGFAPQASPPSASGPRSPEASYTFVHPALPRLRVRPPPAARPPTPRLLPSSGRRAKSSHSGTDGDTTRSERSAATPAGEPPPVPTLAQLPPAVGPPAPLPRPVQKLRLDPERVAATTPSRVRWVFGVDNGDFGVSHLADRSGPQLIITASLGQDSGHKFRLGMTVAGGTVVDVHECRLTRRLPRDQDKPPGKMNWRTGAITSERHQLLVQRMACCGSARLPLAVLEADDRRYAVLEHGTCPLSQVRGLLASMPPRSEDLLALSVAVFRDVIAQLARCEAAGFSYNNTTPSSLVVSSAGTVCLGDFSGSARMGAEVLPHDSAGRIAYLAPERLLYGVAGAQHESFAAAMCALTVACGPPTFAAAEAPGTLAEVDAEMAAMERWRADMMEAPFAVDRGAATPFARAFSLFHASHTWWARFLLEHALAVEPHRRRTPRWLAEALAGMPELGPLQHRGRRLLGRAALLATDGRNGRQAPLVQALSAYRQMLLGHTG